MDCNTLILIDDIQLNTHQEKKLRQDVFLLTFRIQLTHCHSRVQIYASKQSFTHILRKGQTSISVLKSSPGMTENKLYHRQVGSSQHVSQQEGSWCWTDWLGSETQLSNQEMVDGGGKAEEVKEGGRGWDWQWNRMGKWRTAWQMWKDGGWRRVESSRVNKLVLWEQPFSVPSQRLSCLLMSICISLSVSRTCQLSTQHNQSDTSSSLQCTQP